MYLREYVTSGNLNLSSYLFLCIITTIKVKFRILYTLLKSLLLGLPNNFILLVLIDRILFLSNN